MPFVYEDTVRGESRNALAFPSSTREVLTETFAQAYEENPIKATQRLLELREDERTGPRLSPDVARSRLKDAGLENDLRISDAGITDAALQTLMERKRIEKRRQEVFARSEGGVGETAARFGVAFATTLADPVSAGLNFVPVVGQARYAQWLSRSRSIFGRMAVRAQVGAIEGAAGAAIGEVPIYAMRTQEQADYDTTNSLLNVAFGGVVGAGLHTTVGSAAELISRRLPQRVPVQRVEPTIGEAPARAAEPLPADIQRALFSMEDVVDRLPREVQQAALRAAVGQAVEGRPIAVEPIVHSGQSAGGIEVALAGAVRATRFGDQPDPVARDILNTGDIRALDQELAKHGIQNPKPLAGGMSSIVLDAGDRVVRLGVGPSKPRPNVPEVLQAEATGMVGKIGYEILPKAETAGMAESDVLRMSEALQVRGYRFSDAGTDNLGRVGGRTVVLDSGAVEPEFRAAAEHAETTLAREVEPTTEANLKAAEDEAALAETDAKALAERLGVKYEPEEALTEGLEKAERWARVAELATVCLVRGG
jgi:hypothetical protein